MMTKQAKAMYLREHLLKMINKAKAECRELTPEEQKLFEAEKNELIALAEELKATQDKLDDMAAELPAVDEPKEEGAQHPENAPESTEEQPAEEQQGEPEKEAQNENEEASEEQAEEQAETPENEETTQINNNEETPSEEPEKAPEDENENDKNKSNNRSIMADFSLIRAIRSIANNTPLDENTKAVLAAGAEEFRASGLTANGQIQLPGEKRVLSVSTEHDDVIETEFQSILAPLYAKSALAESGAKFLTNLKGDVQIPIMDGKNQVGWEDELTEASETTNTFTSLKATPHRITAYMDISKSMIAQDSIGVENAVRQDLVNALNDKLEATFLGSGNGVLVDGGAQVAPKGILNGKTATTISDYATLCDFESDLEDANIYSQARYILSPKAKAKLRSMNYGGKTTGMVMDTPNSVDGTPAVSTTHITSKQFIYGDFSVVNVCQWSGIDLVIDNVTQATRNCLRIVISAYFDCVVTRPEALLLGEFA